MEKKWTLSAAMLRRDRQRIDAFRPVWQDATRRTMERIMAKMGLREPYSWETVEVSPVEKSAVPTMPGASVAEFMQSLKSGIEKGG